MNRILKDLLSGRGRFDGRDHLLPFFWQHGEDEKTLRRYMGVIQDAGCGAVCVESRPHPDFCGPLWWRDMDVILDEARTRGMRVWILDDDHFPTGHANGALKNAPPELCRQSVYCTVNDYDGPARAVELSPDKLFKPPVYPPSPLQRVLERRNPPRHRHFDDDRPLSLTAVPVDGDSDAFTRRVDLTPLLPDLARGMAIWRKPMGAWRLYACGLSRNYGPHRDYINMMDEASCRVLLDTVYEPHYARYKSDFGNTIAGFFSDEPELGNGQLYPVHNPLGTPQDLPWSRPLEEALPGALGSGWRGLLPLLWENNAAARLIARTRCAYMDTVTRLVERCFSARIGRWCVERGVEYIGHIIEDNNQHTRCGSSLGHFFRGLAGQHYAGIDDIGGQVLPLGEDEPVVENHGLPRDGEFYHYLLGKLASSHAAIDPLKKGRALCEIFGNYGWKAGLRLEKYLVDHFLVRGVNHFTPHAFTPKAYPDPDCPPHFYAQGHNPQFRHFGALMRYTGRLSALLSGGTRAAEAAILYHAEAEWSGAPFMLTQKPARRLLDNQIDFDVIPADVFSEPERYHASLAGGLRVNTQHYKAFVIPAASFIPAPAAQAAAALRADGFPVFFVDALPRGVCSGENELLSGLKACPVVPLDGLVPYLRRAGLGGILLDPADNRVRCLHYENGGDDIYLFVNEGMNAYTGAVSVPSHGACFVYNAWHNRLENIDCGIKGKRAVLRLSIEPLKSLAVIFGDADGVPFHETASAAGTKTPLVSWRRSLCESADYPAFGPPVTVNLPDRLAEEFPAFSGFVRYETTFHLAVETPIALNITDAAEGVEVFVNGGSAGIQIAPPFHYDLAGMTRRGENHLAIEVATTLERERIAGAVSESGITGEVTLIGA